MSDQQIDNAQLAFALARENLGAFIQLMDPTYELAYHHEQIVKQLLRVEAGIDRRVLIQCPPRAGKSQASSIFFPAWYLGKHPNRKVISASCTQDLANDFGSKVRNLIADPRFQAIFPECRLSADMQAKDHFRLTAGGEYFAVGRGSTTVGRGANCLVAGTLVQTERGEVPIEALADQWPSTKVLSYDEKSGRTEYRRVEAFQSRPAVRLRRITSASGRVVESTPDHRIYGAGRYIEAGSLSQGDRLLRSMWEGDPEGGVRHPEARAAWLEGLLLLDHVLGAWGERAAVWAARLLSLWGAGSKSGIVRDWAHPLLQPSLLGRDASREESRDTGSVAVAYLRAVQRAVSGGYRALQLCAGEGRGIALQPALCGSGAFLSDVERGEPEVEAWGHLGSYAAALRSRLSGDAPPDLGARWARLRGLQDREGAAGSPPHRQQPDEQRSVELGDAMLAASSGVACGDGFKAVEDFVALAEDVYRETVVYDIQVERNHNFFANGLLVSNCLIVDDPTKDKIEARSAGVQQEMYDWFSTVARTRLEPPNAIIVIETLWSEAGLSAWLPRTQPNVGWKLLRFPAIAEADEADDSGNVWRKKGEALWPSRFPLADLEEIRDSMRSDDWMCLFQQRATDDAGNYFKTQWLENAYLDKPSSGEGMNRYILVDPATSKKRGSDYTAMWVVGLGADRNYYPLAAVRDKLSLSERADILFKLHADWFPIINVGYEEYALSGDIPYIRERMDRMNYNFTITPLGGGIRKEERIKELEPLFRTARIRMPRYLNYRTILGETQDLMKPFIEEYRSFPNAAHDDMLDSLARITDKALTLDWPMTTQQLEKRAMAAKAASGKGSWMAA